MVAGSQALWNAHRGAHGDWHGARVPRGPLRQVSRTAAIVRPIHPPPFFLRDILPASMSRTRTRTGTTTTTTTDPPPPLTTLRLESRRRPSAGTAEPPPHPTPPDTWRAWLRRMALGRVLPAAIGAAAVGSMAVAGHFPWMPQLQQPRGPTYPDWPHGDIPRPPLPDIERVYWLRPEGLADVRPPNYDPNSDLIQACPSRAGWEAMRAARRSAIERFDPYFGCLFYDAEAGGWTDEFRRDSRSEPPPPPRRCCC